MELMNKDLTMTSLEMVELTGKNHSHIMRDIRDEIDSLENEGLIAFELSEYRDSTGRKLPMYIINKKGLKILAHRYRNVKNNRFHEILKEKGIILDTFHTKTRFEYSFGKALKEALGELGIEVIEQYLVKIYKIDFYLPCYKLAIEYDEEQHKYNPKEDKIREKNIINDLGCKILRLNYKDSDMVNIVKILKNIIKWTT